MSGVWRRCFVCGALHRAELSRRLGMDPAGLGSASEARRVTMRVAEGRAGKAEAAHFFRTISLSVACAAGSSIA
jgi:hypothetical protein